MVFPVGLNAFTQLVVIIGGHPGTRPCGGFGVGGGGGVRTLHINFFVK